MATQQDYYKTLGVERAADADEIRKAYRKLARKHHPDLNPGDKSAEEHFKKVQEAYDILSEPKKKQMYDQYGFYSENGAPGAGPGGPGGPGAGPNMGFGGFDFSDAFARGAGARGRPSPAEETTGFHDIFSQWFGRQNEAPAETTQKGTDLEYGLSVDFWQAVRGTQVRLKISRQEACATCGGTGSRSGTSTVCPECNGSGNVTQMAGAMRFSLTCPKCEGTGRLRNIVPDLPWRRANRDHRKRRSAHSAGRATGVAIARGGERNAGTHGAPPGDLYITLRVEPHPFFRREGDDIHITVPVRIDEAGLGTKIEVPTIDGRALLKIPQGTKNAQKFRLREKGVLNARTNVAAIRSSKSKSRLPWSRTNARRNCCANTRRCIPQDPRAEIWSKV